ncbi:hypothetical protein PDE_01577 [Penicillium oxalicum 114-2]|uniref:EGF-like domain-containing protein n=1 Tax=Penicillium oxalicum (strain 114-2 / CGMCC 5302) TaxID=933388 RepID=S7Z8V5_PENO1|nr:hypothetical protein PDE_01577 [Penicillium oxalicum 114-2]
MSLTCMELAHRTQWPLPDGGLPIFLEPEDPQEPQQPPLLIPRAPPPSRPPRPSEIPASIPSPSVYSVLSGGDSETQSVYPTLPARAFSAPRPLFTQTRDDPESSRPSTKDGSASPTSTLDLNPRISIATEDLFHRQSTASGLSSLPDAPPPRPDHPRFHEKARQRAAGLAPPPHMPKSAVSTISEEHSSSRQTFVSVASSRAMPSSWGSGPPASEIMGVYLEDMSEGEDRDHDHHDDNALLVRNASLGKRGKPTMRTISRAGSSLEDQVPALPSVYHQGDDHRKLATAAGASATETTARRNLQRPGLDRRVSISTASGESFVDPEKPRFAQQPTSSAEDLALEKEIEVLPKAAPTMSDKRPNGKKPPRLNLGAVRDAEARGSLSSLSDLIRRATKLATNLDRGRTASRSDLVDKEAAIFKNALGEPGHRRGSGSISDILTSFPRPGYQTPESHSSWPVFFGRSGLRNVEPLPSGDEPPRNDKPVRKCCGMPRKWFIVLCIILFLVVILAVLLPIFLVAVPHQKLSSGDSNSTAACTSANPCQNGGMSVSSGTQCSCVCSNGFTGSQCTIPGDSSCATAEVVNGATRMNATMGNDLSNVLQMSSKFNVTLDTVTIMALFSMNNASCETENSLVSFDVPTSSSSSSSSSEKTRRAVSLPLDQPDTVDADSFIPSSVREPVASPATLVPRSVATSNGILFDNSASATPGSATSTLAPTASEASATATATNIAPNPESSASTSAAPTTTKVPEQVIQFSRVAVLYILEKTGSLTSAIWSTGQIETYLTESYANATHPQLELMGKYGLDFEKMTITPQ